MGGNPTPDLPLDLITVNLGNIDQIKRTGLDKCSELGYTDASIYDKDWQVRVTCHGHNLNKDTHRRSVSYSNWYAQNKLGKGENNRNAAMLDSCTKKGFGNINGSDWRNMFNFGWTFNVLCTEPRSSMENLLKNSTISCINEDGDALYRLGDDYKTIHRYPSEDIRHSWTGKKEPINYVTCENLQRGADMSRKVIDIPSSFRYFGNNGSVTGHQYCEGGWESKCENKNLKCLGGMRTDTGEPIDCSVNVFATLGEGIPLAYNCGGQLPNKPVCVASSGTDTGSGSGDGSSGSNGSGDGSSGSSGSGDGSSGSGENNKKKNENNDEDDKGNIIIYVIVAVIVLLMLVLLFKKSK